MQFIFVAKNEHFCAAHVDTITSCPEFKMIDLSRKSWAAVRQAGMHVDDAIPKQVHRGSRACTHRIL
jgi:hypothetical protein